MLLFQQYHQNYLKKILRSDFWLYELSIWLHVVALSLIAVFIPILLLQIGYSVGDIMIFYVIYNALDVPLNFTARELIRYIGARWVITLGTIFVILHFILFVFLQPGDWHMLIWMALTAALYDALYWVAHIYLFMNSNQEVKDAGKNTGIFYVVKQLGTMIAPIFGAITLILSGKDMLLYTSILIFVLSLVPLIWVDDFNDRPKKALVKMKKFFSHPREKKNFVTTTMFSIHSAAEGVIWPVFIFVLFGTIGSVALIPVVVAASTLLFTYFAGTIKRNERERVIIIGAVAICLVWVARLYFDAVLFYHASVFLVGLFALMVTVPLDSNVFTRGVKVDALQTATYRNVFHMFAKLLFYAALAVLINIFHVSFLVSAFAMFIIILANYFFILLYYGEENGNKIDKM